MTSNLLFFIIHFKKKYLNNDKVSLLLVWIPFLYVKRDLTSENWLNMVYNIWASLHRITYKHACFLFVFLDSIDQSLLGETISQQSSTTHLYISAIVPFLLFGLFSYFLLALFCQYFLKFDYFALCFVWQPNGLH